MNIVAPDDLSEHFARQYDRANERRASHKEQVSKAGRDIGPIPPVANPRRRAKCEKNLKLALTTYFPEAFYFGFSPDHERFIEEVELTLKEGRLKVQAMPRGNGKSTIIRLSILLALVYGWRRLAVIVAATEAKALEQLHAIQTVLQTNDLLLEDFPEVCYPIRKLENSPGKARGQLCMGESTSIRFGKDFISFPAIRLPKNWGKPSCKNDWQGKREESPSYGHAVVCTGIEGSGIRGTFHTLPNGEIIRPEVVMIDDPQNDGGAIQAKTVRKLERIIKSAILGMAGPGRKISALAAVTVIERGDLSDRLLNRTLNPEWRGDRCKLLNSLPDAAAMKLWHQYYEIKSKDLQRDGDGSAATQFYQRNHAAMNSGAEVAWKDRYEPDEIDALQNAMNIYFLDKETFYSEYQNEPLDDSDTDEPLTADQIRQRVNLVDRYVVPMDATTITCHIDVMDAALYYAVLAWTPDFRGYVIDYATFPEQKKRYYDLKNLNQTLVDKYGGVGVEVAIEKGLHDLVNYLATKDYIKEGDGGSLQLDLILIDEGYKDDIVHRVIERSEHKARLRAAKGFAIGAKNAPMSEWRKEPGEKKGDNWTVRQVKGYKIRRILFNPNHWKSYVINRVTANEGDPHSITFFGRDEARHELISDHLCAEYKVIVEAKGRRVEEWMPRPGKPDNHYLDNIVGAAVAASTLGCKMPTIGESPKKKTRRRKRKLISYAK